MTLRVYNTLTREEEPFQTIEPGKVRMYVCGPTVYADAHIGHGMSAMVFDVIRRYLEYAGYEVKHAQNFTDIDEQDHQPRQRRGAGPERAGGRVHQSVAGPDRRLECQARDRLPTRDAGTRQHSTR